LGLKFVSTHKGKPHDVLQCELAEFGRKVRLCAQFGSSITDTDAIKYRVKNSAFQPKTASADIEAFIADFENTVSVFHSHEPATDHIPANMTKIQETAISRLQRDPSIVIKPADKNLGLCIVDKKWYTEECAKQLSDTAKYATVTDPPALVLATVVGKIKKAVHIHSCMRSLPSYVSTFIEQGCLNCEFPSFYEVPKIHKVLSENDKLTGRPVIPGHSGLRPTLPSFSPNYLILSVYHIHSC
jgi:hypothetical protein